ncbi:hypothetical protein DPMN_039201 [Dreissena polymorpha]|uniref:Uncharacterized protein n=1 Tax=Dreissena polymorpha TaxID=45954 RepID=A0A9D4MGW4_DREPO|nr:hypothetical protein DPMN_039201 [Dreissena polymorpha]
MAFYVYQVSFICAVMFVSDVFLLKIEVQYQMTVEGSVRIKCYSDAFDPTRTEGVMITDRTSNGSHVSNNSLMSLVVTVISMYDLMSQ